MIIVTRSQVTGAEHRQLIELLQQLAGSQRPISAITMQERQVICVDGNSLDAQAHATLSRHSAVERIVSTGTPYQLVSRAFQSEDSHITVGDLPGSQPVTIGGPAPVIIAGPCAVESREQLMEIARAVKDAGAQVLRGGAFKPRTSPYQFQGLGVEGLHLLAQAREETGLPVITEVMEPEMVDVVAQYADVLQIGSRYMQNFPLLRAVGGHAARPPVMLKRGLAATID